MWRKGDPSIAFKHRSLFGHKGLIGAAEIFGQHANSLGLRFGLDGQERHTLAEIGRQLDVSRERVRQVELKALRKLRNLTRRTTSTL